ncbi:MAG: hypothetical protein FRX49_02877 [Trebouxia sp. A1-2]|nr:MAG: hypothetical protein FRX49_02877 [Trebouxia sp. A1-2]
MAVDGHVHHCWVLFKDLLSTIAMVNIPVQYEHPLSSCSLHTPHHSSLTTTSIQHNQHEASSGSTLDVLSSSAADNYRSGHEQCNEHDRSYGSIVEEAETHGRVALSMVAWGSHNSHASCSLLPAAAHAQHVLCRVHKKHRGKTKKGAAAVGGLGQLIGRCDMTPEVASNEQVAHRTTAAATSAHAPAARRAHSKVKVNSRLLGVCTTRRGIKSWVNGARVDVKVIDPDGAGW